MAYHYHPGQKVRFIGRSEPGKKVQTGDVGMFSKYEENPMISKIQEAAKLSGIELPPIPVLVSIKYYNEDGTVFDWHCALHEIEPIFDTHEPAQWTEEDLKWLPDCLKRETSS